jgi:hypothetical protein
VHATRVGPQLGVADPGDEPHRREHGVDVEAVGPLGGLLLQVFVVAQVGGDAGQLGRGQAGPDRLLRLDVPLVGLLVGYLGDVRRCRDALRQRRRGAPDRLDRRTGGDGYRQTRRLAHRFGGGTRQPDAVSRGLRLAGRPGPVRRGQRLAVLAV